MKKITKEQWEIAIRTARQFVVNYAKVRWKIADLALEVCDTSHGGRKSESLYSLARFAKEIELNRKTLYEWVRVKKRVIEKLPDSITKTSDEFNYYAFKAVDELVQDDDTPLEVKRRFEEVLGRSPEARKFEKYIKVINSIFWNASRPMVMKDVPTLLIETMIEKINIVQTLLNKEIELRTKFAEEGRERDAERLNIPDELKKRILKGGAESLI